MGPLYYQSLIFHGVYKPLIPTPRGFFETVKASLGLAYLTADIVEPLWLTHVHCLLNCAIEKCRLHFKLANCSFSRAGTASTPRTVPYGATRLKVSS